MKEYGLDLSVHNGTVDFNAIKKAGHTFVILRAGYGSSISQKDKNFETYYKAAKAAGLKVGVYWYSYALTAAQGTEEAKVCLEAIKGKTFEYPVYIDMEDADQYKRKHGMPSNAILCAICENFCKYLEGKGYYVGVYASESWFYSQLKNMSRAYDLWVANWGTNNGTLQADKLKSYHLHQYTSMYMLNGKRYDKNISYFDYAKIIKEKKLNGFSSSSNVSTKPTTQTPPNGSTLELVVAVMQGKYGNGDERKTALGSKYDAVQDMINHIATASVETLVNEVIAGKYGNDNVRKTALGSRYDEVQTLVNKKFGATSLKMRKGAKVKYTGYVYADSNGNGKGAKISGTYTVTIYNSNPYGTHLDGLGWVKPGNCTVIA